MIARAAAADALVLVPRGEGELEAGEPCATCRFADRGPSSHSPPTRRAGASRPPSTRSRGRYAGACRSGTARSGRPREPRAAPRSASHANDEATAIQGRSRRRRARAGTTARRARARAGSRRRAAGQRAGEAERRAAPHASGPVAWTAEARARHGATAAGRSARTCSSRRRAARSGEREQRDRVPGELLLLPARRRGSRRSRATSQPTSSSTPSTPSTAGQGSSRPGPAAAVAPRPVGKTPSREAQNTSATANTQKRAGWRRLRAAGASGIRCRRQSANRSTVPIEKRQQRRDQDELDRPAADDARAEVDVARRPLCELEALVERAEQVLRGAAELAEPPRR